MYTPLERLAIWIYSFVTPLHRTIERLTTVRTKNKWQKHVGFFTPNIRRLFPPEQIYIPSVKPIPKGYIFISKKNPWTIRKCQEFAEETGLPYYIVQPLLSRKTSYTGILVTQLIADQVSIHMQKASYLAKVAAIYRADTIRLTRVRLEMQNLYPALPESHAKELLRRLFKQRKGDLAFARNLDVVDIVHLAVAAYARHHYTDYDKMRNRGFRLRETRKRIEKEVELKVREWSGQEKRKIKPKRIEANVSKKLAKAAGRNQAAKNLIKNLMRAEVTMGVAASSNNGHGTSGNNVDGNEHNHQKANLTDSEAEHTPLVAPTQISLSSILGRQTATDLAEKTNNTSGKGVHPASHPTSGHTSGINQRQGLHITCVQYEHMLTKSMSQ